MWVNCLLIRMLCYIGICYSVINTQICIITYETKYQLSIKDSKGFSFQSIPLLIN